MTLRVIGAGFGRTGTMSLKAALERLGLGKCYHMLELAQNPHHAELWQRAHRGEAVAWDTLFEGYQAAVDWPSCNFWREQLAHYPDARVLLSLRSPDSWYDSVMETIYAFSHAALESGDPRLQAHARLADELIWQGVFDGRIGDRAHAIDTFERHNQAVIDAVPAARLLVFEARDGWAPLCRFLDVAVPDEPYPRVNTRDQFPPTL